MQLLCFVTHAVMLVYIIVSIHYTVCYTLYSIQ